MPTRPAPTAQPDSEAFDERPPKRRVADRRHQDRRRILQSSDQTGLARIRQMQWQRSLSRLPLLCGLTLLEAITLATLHLDALGNMLLMAWISALLLLGGVALHAWLDMRKAPKPAAISTQRIHLLTAHSAALAAIWAGGALATVLAAPASRAHVMPAFWLMLAVGAYSWVAVPHAAMTFIGCLALAGATLFAEDALLLVQWLGVAGLALASALTSARRLREQVTSTMQLEHQQQLIGLLLRDFEEHGSDVLWEIDAKGRLIHVNQRLADALGRTIESIQGRPFLGLLSDLQTTLPDSDREAADALRRRLTEGRPFRDVLLPLMVRGSLHWWSVTAKPLVDERRAAMGWRGVARDVTQSRLADRKLAWLAHYDTLTGLTNRARFRVVLENSLKTATARAGHGAVMCLDLDNFKTVNDTLGHATGDALLIEVGRRVKSAVERTDVVARLGGDEFAVLLRHATEESEVQAAADRIILAMSEPCQVLGAVVPVRASIGIARFPHDGITVDEMMQHADLALYDAKTHQPGSVRFFASRMGEQIRRRLVLERDLREAIERGQLALHFQPKVDLETWEVQGFEALLRWRHPEHGDIPPVEFIPVAEESGLILQMGEWALREACRQAATWPAQLQVAVNISPVQVMAQNLPNAIRRALHESHLPPHRLELEITESVFINETSGTVDQLHALRKLGVQIALDDFGTGYSSLAYLRRFPFDTLKIDRAFVRELLTSRDARAIVRNILALASSLRMATVAEGVEEPAQVAVLENEGCNLVQGYFVSKPIPGDQVASFVAMWAGRDRPRMPENFRLRSTEMAPLATSTVP